MDRRLRAELTRVVESAGPGADHAAIALGGGPLRQRLRSSMLALAESRGPGSSTCPSDAARAVEAENWRDLMPEALAIARELAQLGEVEITQRGNVLEVPDVQDADRDWRGPIRIRTSRR